MKVLKQCIVHWSNSNLFAWWNGAQAVAEQCGSIPSLPPSLPLSLLPPPFHAHPIVGLNVLMASLSKLCNRKHEGQELATSSAHSYDPFASPAIPLLDFFVNAESWLFGRQIVNTTDHDMTSKNQQPKALACLWLRFASPRVICQLGLHVIQEIEKCPHQESRKVRPTIKSCRLFKNEKVSFCFQKEGAEKEDSTTKGLQVCNSPMCTLSQNGYGTIQNSISRYVMDLLELAFRIALPLRY